MSGLINVVRKAKPFFSRVDEAAQNLPRNKGTGKEFMTELKKQPGVKKAEIEDRKLAEIESAPKMTKEQFLKKLEEKPAPEVEEKVIGINAQDPRLVQRAEEIIKNEAIREAEAYGGSKETRRATYERQHAAAMQDFDLYIKQAAEEMGIPMTGYDRPDLILPGGKNYREILLKLPIKEGDIRVVNQDGDIVAEGFSDEASARQYIQDQRSQSGFSFNSLSVESDPMGAAYQSRHWDDPNVLAHIRVSDRTGPNGEKILHIEEIQSDWHQEGRKKGYKGTPSSQAIEAGKRQAMALGYGEDQINAMSLEQLAHFTGAGSQSVPDAPFKKNWHELAMKRVMDYATEGGYDKVAITPGAQQADRYNLAKFITSIDATPVDNGEGYIMKIVDKNGKTIANHRYEANELEDQVGKEMADRIISGGGGKFEGLDLQVGGEGMKGFYDQILPAYINKEYGKYGARVGTMPIETGKETSGGWAGTSMTPLYQPTYTDLHSVDITPEMREAIKAKGQPLYQAIGVGLTGAAAAPKEEVHFSDNPDAMMMEMEDRGFAGGGLLRKAARASAKEAATPAVNRVDMNYKDVTKRVPELTEAAKKIPTGELSAEEYAKLVNQFKPVTPYKFVPQPATEEDATRALTSNKKAMFGKTKEIPAGQIADLRLDIPAYKDHGVWVNSVHRKDEPTVYGSVSSVKNATMFGAPEKALRVATGEAAKGPWAVISGEWNPIDEADAVKSAQKYLKHKDWRQVGYDPERHGYFYDRETMAPVVGAEEVIQIGPLVLAKKPTLGDAKDFPFREGGEVKIINKVQGALTKAKRK